METQFFKNKGYGDDFLKIRVINTLFPNILSINKKDIKHIIFLFKTIKFGKIYKVHITWCLKHGYNQKILMNYVQKIIDT